MTEQGGTMRWRWIVLWMILFWPVGLVLLAKRMSADKSALFKSAKSISIASYVLMGLTALMVIAAFSPSSGSTDGNDSPSTGGALGTAFVFGVGAAVLYWYARQLKGRADRYKKYIALVVNQQQTSIDNIASAVGTSYDLAAKDLQRMIDQDYFVGAHLDVAQREIVLATPVAHAAPQFAAAAEQARVVTCSGCGANNRLSVGQLSECEFCGAPL